MHHDSGKHPETLMGASGLALAGTRDEDLLHGAQYIAWVTCRPFISYAKEDAEVAERLYADLRGHGADPWLDRHALRGGESWSRPSVRCSGVRHMF
jgi:hypothetical protein